MSQRIAYFRVSTNGQSIEAQRAELGGSFDREFTDAGISGAIPARQRPAMAELLDYARSGDTVYVYGVDRLGRDSIDVQTTVRDLLSKGVALHVHGIGPIAGEAGKLVLALLAQIAEMERAKIIERTEAGRKLARETIASTGKTHRGKLGMGRPFENEPAAIVAWRMANKASIAQTAQHFAISIATVKRAALLCKQKETTND
jgi:putative DNA-invertase from lambdoid prophage Rac